MAKETIHPNKRDHFYQKALELIHKKGFKAMTIRDLANALNCDSANIYNYTKSKMGILETLLFQTSTYFHQGIDQILASQLNPIQQLEEVVRLHVTLSSSKPLQVSLVVNEWRNLSEEKRMKFLSERGEYEQKVGKVLMSGIEKKYFRPFNVSIVTQILLGSLRWQHSYYLGEGEKSNPLSNFQEIKDLLLPGFLLPPTE